jgi:hypothetical protein
MRTVRSKLSGLPALQRTTLGRLDKKGQLSTNIKAQLYRTTITPLQSSDIYWKKQKPGLFDHWDGLYVLNRTHGVKVSAIYDSKGISPFEQCWNSTALDIPVAESRPADIPADIFSPLSYLVRSELERLPSDLSVWDRERAPPYCGGVGGVLVILCCPRD